jgi:ABC-type transport system substrate-binding protein
MSEGGLIFDSSCAKGAKFHNGEPVIAEDVKFSLERYHGTAYEMMKERIETMEAHIR